ncbi:family 43 glycosylhydrolase [Gynuella sp.]|uniref:family 43 glycosylhydrolase n=1 Tax=Gynuella sp. TaxID=2969146 RepID=UPI003D0AA086
MPAYRNVRCGLLWLLVCISTNVMALSNGVYTITSKHSGKRVEVINGASDNGANIQQWPANGYDAQRWLITHVEGDYYSLINLSSGKAMEVYDFGTSDGANVSQWEYLANHTQQWRVKQERNGYYSFINRNSGKALDLYNFNTANGANIAQWSYNGSDAQLWSLSQLGTTGQPGWDPSTTNGATDHWSLSGNLVTHDPTLAYENGNWWVFQTGPGIYSKHSSNGTQWTGGNGGVFPNGLSWWRQYVPGHDGQDVWAPDVKSYNGRTWMYYSISTFGSNVSAIGLASTSSISSGRWRDDGLVVSSNRSQNFNAIDPDLVVDADGNPWLAFGSFWSGIQLTRLNPLTMKPYGPQYNIAYRGNEGIEAPSIIYRRGYYYLFVSVGKCCQGTSSTYQIRYGRATDIRGPYLDKNGRDLLSGGGSLLDGGNNRWIGPGGQDILNTDVIVRHAYDASDDGTPKLLISILNWDSNGWPRY